MPQKGHFALYGVADLVEILSKEALFVGTMSYIRLLPGSYWSSGANYEVLWLIGRQLLMKPGLGGLQLKLALDRWLARFQTELKQKCADAIELYSKGNDPPVLIQRLRKAFLVKDVGWLSSCTQVIL